MSLFEFQEEEPMHFSFDRLQRLIKDGYITKRPHPNLPLFILNYAPKTQWERKWTPETIMCRGLVVDERWKVVARPFGKFFNYEELTGPNRIESEAQELDRCLAGMMPFTVQEKMDGSLIIAFDYKGEMVTATRGCFDSRQVHEARRIFGKKHRDWRPFPGITYLFEVIYPENRIVVNYGDVETLCLLAERDTITGREHRLTDQRFPTPQRYHIENFNDLFEWPQSKNAEGFVICFRNGFRFKIKWDEYKRLHRLLCGITPKMIWELLAAKDVNGIRSLRQNAPDEWHQWMDQQIDTLTHGYQDHYRVALADYLEGLGQGFTERKQWAEFFGKKELPGVCFLMLDGKDPWELIWKKLKPVGGQPYRSDED